jgi:hypothetical protein
MSERATVYLSALATLALVPYSLWLAGIACGIGFGVALRERQS